MITEDYCSEEITSLLEENGYVGPTYIYLDKDGFRVKKITLQSAMKWLREAHNLNIMIDCVGSRNYIPTIQFMDNGKDITIEGKDSRIGGNGFDSYEDACEAAIKYCLKNLV